MLQRGMAFSKWCEVKCQIPWQSFCTQTGSHCTPHRWVFLGHLVSIGWAQQLFWQEILLNLQKANKECPFSYYRPHTRILMLTVVYERQVSFHCLQKVPCYLVYWHVELTIFWRTVRRISIDHTNEFSWRRSMVDVKAMNQATYCWLELVAPP